VQRAFLPLPWGEVAARSAAGEGVRTIERAKPLTPTLSQWEREFTTDAEQTLLQLQTAMLREAY